MITRAEVAKMAFVRSILPSKKIDGDITTRAEAYGRVSCEDLNLACTYKKACAKAANQGLPFPPAPVSLNGLAMDFFLPIYQSHQHRCNIRKPQQIEIDKTCTQLTIRIAKHTFGSL